MNEDYFETPTIENSYWAGFIAADGCIYLPKVGQKQLILSIDKKDNSSLESLKQSLCWGGNITNQLNRKRLYICSNKLCGDLYKNWNITPNKTFTYSPDYSYSNKLNLAFIVGYIDGDGYISTYTEKRSGRKIIELGIVSASSKFLEKTAEIFKENGTEVTIRKHEENTQRITVTQNKARAIIQMLSEPKVPRLLRKWAKINEI